MGSDGTSGTLMRSPREEQALREVGRTAVARPVAAALSVVSLLSILAVPAVQTLADLRGGEQSHGESVLPRLRGLLSALPRAARAGSPLAANHELQAAIDAFEERLEEESVLRRGLLPPVQRLLTTHLGLGNEQAYGGRDDWLFYRPDVDHVMGPGFLEPRRLEARRRGGDAWEPAPQPDPLPALVELRSLLDERGIELLVVPTPVKPGIEPERFTARLGPGAAPLRNASFEAFRRQLEEAGIAMADPAPWLAEAKRRDARPQYLETDTHWTPEAMDRVAAELARRARERLGERPGEAAGPWDPAAGGYTRRAATIEGRGDIAAMLRLGEGARLYPPQRVEVRPVTTIDGRLWRPDRSAEVLLLGDSFSNIYSDATLGWGAGAGLAEQLSYHLQRPLDRIALNAGGAHATRAALHRDLAAGRDRLAGKRLVIYQFAVRELSQGDWKLFQSR